MEKLLFKDIYPDAGVHITVRNGRKWFDLLDNFEGRELTVDVESADGVHLGRAKMLGFDNLHVSEIRQAWLDLQYDPRARTSEGMDKVMQEVYGDAYTPENVTVIMFNFAPAW